jgi:hypothetical protein
MFTFLNPLLLIGLSAAAVPVLIHLLSRRRLRTVYFSAMRFLQTSHRKGARRIRIRQLLLIILRALLFSITAMALARPYLGTSVRSPDGVAALSDLQKSIVIILDNSFSMGYRRSIKSKLEMAKEEADRIIRSLKGGDEVSLILMSDQAEVVVRGSSAATFRAAQELQRAVLSHRPSRIVPSLSAAYSILESSRNPEKAIFILTDLQGGGWRDFDLDRIGNYDLRVKLFIIGLSGEGETNGAIADVRTPPSMVGEDRPIEMTAAVTDYGNGAPQTLSLFVSDRKRGEKHLEKPGMASFSLTLSPAGTYPGYVRSDDDPLDLDNRRYFVLDVGRSTAVLIADNSRGRSSYERDGFFLNFALSPPLAADDGESPGLPIKATLTDMVDLPSANLPDYRVAIIANLDKPSPEVGLSLSKFVDGGGGLVIFLGDGVDAASYNETLSDLLPATLAEKRVGSPISLGEIDGGNPIFSPFKGGMSERVDFTGFFRADVKSGATVLARLSDGTPLIVEKAYGRGKVIMVASSADAAWNNMPVKTIYLPVMRRMVDYLSGLDNVEPKTIIVGETYTKKMGWEALGKAIVVTNPLGEREKVIAKPAPGGALITYSSARWAGLYQIKAEGMDDDYFAVNLDASESDITPLGQDEIKGFFPDGTVYVSSDVRSLMSNLGTKKGNYELWKPFLSVVLLLMIAESIVAHRWDVKNVKRQDAEREE